MWKWIFAAAFITAAITGALTASADQLGGEYGLVETTLGGDVVADIDFGSYDAHFNDDSTQSFGNTASAPDAWFEWDTGAATDNFRLTLTDCDGGGTDCQPLYWNTGTDDAVMSGDLTIGGDTVLSTPADGDLLVANNAGTKGVWLNTSTYDGYLQLDDESGAGAGIDLDIGKRIVWGNVSGTSYYISMESDRFYVRNGYGAAIVHGYDMTSASRGILEIGQSSANNELTGSSGVQYGMSIGNSTYPFEVNQSGTAGYHALHIDVTETATGSGEKHLIDADVGGASKFSIDNGGEVSASGISGDGSGKAVCIKADGNLGTCTDAVGAGGTCTCN